MFFRFIVSVHDRTTATSRVPAAMARSRPFRLGASADARNGASASASAITAVASAICGTALGETKLVASMLGTPAAASARISAALPAVPTCCGWFCRPSRSATSVTTTRSRTSGLGEGCGSVGIGQWRGGAQWSTKGKKLECLTYTDNYLFHSQMSTHIREPKRLAAAALACDGALLE